MKLWVDDIRPAPDGYVWAKSTEQAINIIRIELGLIATCGETFEVIDMDHDAGRYAEYGGDYIKILDWMESKGISIPIHIHSMNPVGVQNMRAIIQRNNWTEIR